METNFQPSKNLVSTKSIFLSLTLLLLILLSAIPPIIVSTPADTTYHMEVITILSSQESWIRGQAGEKDAWLLPSFNGRVRINKPPLAVWANLAAWHGLDAKTTPPETLVFRARCVALGIALLTLAATAAIAWFLLRSRFFLLAPLITATALLFLKHARLDAYDIYLTGLCTAAIAAAIGAHCGLCKKVSAILGTARRTPALGGDFPSRLPSLPRRGGPAQSDGGVVTSNNNQRLASYGLWLLYALASSAAVLAKGPLALLFILAPIVIYLWIMTAGQRRGFAANISIFTILALLLAAPWFLYAVRHVPNALGIMAHEASFCERAKFQPIWYYLCLFPLIFPWTILFLAYLIAAFRQKLYRQKEILFTLVWTATIFLFLSIPAAKQQRYILPLIPVVGILLAQLVSKTPASRFITISHQVHWFLLAFASVGAIVFIAIQNNLVAAKIIATPLIVGVPLLAVLILAILLAVVVYRGFSFARRERYTASVIATAIWMLLISTVGFYGYARSAENRYPFRQEAERLAAIVGTNSVAYLIPKGSINAPSGMTVYKEEPDQKFLFYMRRIIPAVAPSNLVNLATVLPKTDRIFLIARVTPEITAIVTNQPFHAVTNFTDGARQRRLYEFQQ